MYRVYWVLTWTTAWKKAKTKTSVGKAECVHSASDVAEILKYVLRRFNFKPLGGSVTTYWIGKNIDVIEITHTE